MEVSSGIILYRNTINGYEFFVCTPGGPYWHNRELWNFPKGHVENGETPFIAALREFKEETSISLSDDESKYNYLGLIKQNNKKHVHVFSKEYEGEDYSNCYSNECVSIINGVEISHPEVKAYSWMTIEELENKGMKCYIPIFKIISDSD